MFPALSMRSIVILIRVYRWLIMERTHKRWLEEGGRYLLILSECPSCVSWFSCVSDGDLTCVCAPLLSLCLCPSLLHALHAASLALAPSLLPSPFLSLLLSPSPFLSLCLCLSPSPSPCLYLFLYPCLSLCLYLYLCLFPFLSPSPFLCLCLSLVPQLAEMRQYVITAYNNTDAPYLCSLQVFFEQSHSLRLFSDCQKCRVFLKLEPDLKSNYGNRMYNDVHK